MIPAHRTTTEPVPVHIGGCAWSLLFNMWAVRKLCERYAPEAVGLEGLQKAGSDLAARQVDAIAAFLWAGLLHESPGLTFDETLALLDEAYYDDLILLPREIEGAIRAALGDPGGGQEGDSWDWEMALAVWTTEWGQPREEFWRTTFREFASISNGRARLYDRAKTGARNQSDAPEGYTLQELLMMGRRR